MPCEELPEFLIHEFYLLAHVSVLEKLVKLKRVIFTSCFPCTIIDTIIFEKLFIL